MFRWLACCCEQSAVTQAEIEQVGLFPDNCVSFDPQGQSVTYTSDVDGRWDYFCNFVDHSKGLCFRVDMEHSERRATTDLDLELEEGWHFVYGGDVSTRGAGTLRFLDTMLRLKKRYAGRVHLLLGFKDLEMQSWTQEVIEDFEDRRKELAHLERKSTSQVSDDDVSKSYEDSLKPGGLSYEFLQMSQLAIMLGDTVFMYGEILSGMTAEDIRNGPKHAEVLKLGMAPVEDEQELEEDLQDWVYRLNSFVKGQIRQWELGKTTS